MTINDINTGEDLKALRIKSGMKLKDFYEKWLGYEYFSTGQNLEKNAVISDTVKKRIEESRIFEYLTKEGVK